MAKMASDFLQSNLFSPTAPSEQFLERARRRRIKGSNSDIQEANRGGLFPIQFSKSPDQTLDRAYNFHCNNNNSYAFQNCNNYRNPQGKKTTGASPQLTQPMLKSMLSEGLVKLPGPPVHSRPEFSSKAAVLATASRRDRVKNICSRNSHQDHIIFSGTREILTKNNQVQSFYSQAYSLGQLFPREANINLMNGTGICSDENSYVASHKTEDVNEQSNDLIDSSTKISQDETVEQIHNQDAQEEISIETSVPLQGNEPLSKDTKSELICNDLDHCDSLHRFPDKRKGESNNLGSDNNQNMDDATALSDTFNLLQIKTEIDKLNLINKYNADNASKPNASQDIAKSLFRETLESRSSPFEQKSEIKSVEICVTDKFTTSSDEVEKVEIKPTNLTKKNNGSRKFSKKRKQLLRLLHLFLDIRWMKTPQKEDKKSLVEEEITEGDGAKIEITSKRIKKKMRDSNQPSKGQKTRTQENQNSGQDKDLTPIESTMKKKKRRRPRKKNLVRCGRRLRKNLTKECCSIVRDLASISYMLPESYTCPRRFGGIPCQENTPTDRIYPNAPSWEGDKRYPVYDFC